MSESAPGRASSDSTDAGKELTECPTCGRDDFKSERGIKQHHARAHDESISGELVECETCSKEYREIPARIERAENNFCSVECRSEWQKIAQTGENNPAYSGGEYVECAYCNDEFWLNPCNDYEYCSHSCAVKSREWNRDNHPNYNSVVIECDYCSDTLERIKSRVDEFERQFCDDECKGKWYSENLNGEDHPLYEGGEIRYGKGWKKARELALGRDNHSCQVCGVGRDNSDSVIDVHHIKPVRGFDKPNEAHNLLNVVTLCRSCHRMWEGIPLRPDTR